MKKPKYELGEKIIMPAQITEIAITSQGEVEYDVELLDDVLYEIEIDEYNSKLNNPDDSLLTEKSEVADTYIAGVVWGYNRGVKDCERGLQLSPETSTNKVDTPTNTPTNTSTDLISRQAAIEAMAPFDTNHELRDTLDALPSVEPERPKRTETMMVDGEPTEIDPLSYEVGYSHGQSERPKGEWILDGGTPICSVCHEEPCWSSEGYYFTDFCPNCGADCRGEEDD